jgi:hypothetical protein
MVKDYLERNYKIQEGPDGVLEVANVGRDPHLAELFHKLDFKLGAEIGVESGVYSEALLKANPQATVYSIDPWAPYRGYKDFTKETTFSKLQAAARDRLGQYPNSKVLQKFSADALHDFEDGSLDFVYIDANHQFEHVLFDVSEWTKKVRPGGIVAGHDYVRMRPRTNEGGEHSGVENWSVIQALAEYRKTNPVQLYIWGLNAKDGQIRDPYRSWMFVK